VLCQRERYRVVIQARRRSCWRRVSTCLAGGEELLDGADVVAAGEVPGLDEMYD